MNIISYKFAAFISLFWPCCLLASPHWNSAAPIQPIPYEFDQQADKVDLGEALFNDPRLSRDNVFSCAYCHQLEQGGDDGLSRAMTNDGKTDIINTPTVFNSRYNFRQTWEGKFRSLEKQAEGDIHNPRHGNSNWSEVLKKLRADKLYRDKFKKIYKDGIKRSNILDAIASYERSLITPDSRFDQYMRGNESAITEKEKQGYEYFKEYGCVACHQGINVGGNMYQKFGLFDDYFKWRGGIQPADYGRYSVTGKEEDRFVFRVPSLRNVEVTSPYLHDGSIDELQDVVKLMARFQLGTYIPDEKLAAIVAFLKTLTGKYKGKYLEDKK